MPQSDPCAACGHCPTCGRGPVQVQPYPYPVYPWWQYQQWPYGVTWTSPNISVGTVSSGTTSVTWN